MRAAFYYPWYPGHWPESAAIPDIGPYDSLDMGVARLHVAQMQYARINVGISSWWGQGDFTDNALKGLLLHTQHQWCPYYELDIGGHEIQYKSDLAYFSNLARSPKWLKIGGKPVIFVYRTWSEEESALAKKWAPDWYVSTQTPGADHQHIYNPAVPSGLNVVSRQSISIAPGFRNEVPRDLSRWQSNVNWLKATEAAGWPWQLITTWNEWPENTGIEPAPNHDFIRSLR